MPEHGGGILRAARRYGIPPAEWLDLSTGINPAGWPVPALPPSCWNRLPEEEDGLEQVAQDYYHAPLLLPVAGSQAAIQTLPRLRRPGRVGVLHPSFSEHAAAWRRAGHHVDAIAAERLEAAADTSDVLVLSNPNNPTGIRFPPERLLHWHRRLAARGGWLVVDEAFMDPTPEQSLCPHAGKEGLVVLRSLGKFFGLAGARVGFVCADAPLLARLRGLLGPWHIATPARLVAAGALADHAWQRRARRRLAAGGRRLEELLRQSGLAPDGGCALFQWAPTPRAREIQQRLARHGILVRRFDDPPALRLGLPGDEQGWRRLHAALARLQPPSPMEASQ